jgi:myo-inositol-1(or 4)-monophosphatase
LKVKEFLKHLMTAAGAVCQDYRSRLDSLGLERKSPKDIVTEADIAVEQYLVGQIKQHYPEHGILGEETGSHAGTGYRWVIDPIDGTTSFLHGQPFFSISVAVEKDGDRILGAVLAPALGELYLAEKGRGATCNGAPIQVSRRDRLLDSVLATGFACIRSAQKRTNLPYFAHLLPKIRDVRRYGSAAVDLCYVASGRLEGFWELNLNLYDIAAGWLILEEAGGRLTDFSGGTGLIPQETVATNGLIHDDLIRELSAVDTE